MPNKDFSEPKMKLGLGTGTKVMPKAPVAGSTTPASDSLRMATANWPGLPGKAQKDRSSGFPEEKQYAVAKGLRGGSDNDKGESKES